MVKNKTALAAVSLLLVAVLVIGCSSNSNNTTPNEPDQPEQQGTDAPASPEERVTLTWVVNAPPEINFEDNPIIEKAEELSGYDLEVIAPPQNNYDDRINLMASSGDLPDLFWGGTDAAFERMAEEGVLAVLDDKLADYPNLNANITEGQYSDTRAFSTGKIHSVPRPGSYDRWGYLINQTWLDNLGLEAPRTIEEFVEVARAFTFDDPDQNGVDDTFGVSIRDIIQLRTDFISTAFDLSAHWGMPAADGKYYTRENHPRYVEYLDFMRGLYEEGVLDTEYITHATSTDIEELFAQGRVGIQGYSGAGFTKFADQYSMSIDEFSYHAPLAFEGEAPVYMMPPSNWGAWHIPASSDKIDHVLAFLDWANSEEGVKLFHLGLEGEHYNSYDLEARTIDRTPEQLQLRQSVTAPNIALANAFQARQLIEGGATDEATAKWEQEFNASLQGAEHYYVPFVKPMSALSAENPELTLQSETLRDRYVVGQISKDELTSFITSTWAVNQSVIDIEQQYNEWMTEYPLTIE